MKTKRITIDVSPETFAWLEVLAVGLACKDNGDDIDARNADIKSMYRKTQNDFGKGVSDLLEKAAYSFVDGVKRSGSWERQVLLSLFGYDGEYLPNTISDVIKEEAAERGFKTE